MTQAKAIQVHLEAVGPVCLLDLGRHEECGADEAERATGLPDLG
eukprot:CAMPEP_0177557288 /NCGR_PEP_ID=MMETSP0369-20130122/69581_1 /TAXON_ID=447022 ORGANISM="Scrippsiella hangoei-like, Strain SHHI-4" /NCGR_SAMPLE_ID=MMETSP0369 /ASSEMBLY_ACC=CAM_ASM_000364 /LENGTH=43 /DNA_ID= /DNA_START= /DNA_END= /DNA_ORIENTATION=